MQVHRFGEFTLVPRERRLLRLGDALPLGGKPFDLLVALVENAGRLVSKDELMARVWPGVVVEEVNLSVNISALRKSLAISPGSANWIEAVPRQGYRFLASVATSDEDIAPGAAAVIRPMPRWTATAGAIASLVLLAAATLWGVRGDASGAAGRNTASSQAYQQYLLGRYQWNQRSEPALKQAVTHFERAVALDPEFAMAYAALADAYTALGYLGYVPPVATFPVARPHALKALELDPSLAQAHATLAYIKFYFDWDWAGAEQEFKRALALKPADAVSHQWYAVYLRAAGRGSDAQREIETAHRLDPLSLAINTDVGFHHYYAGRYPEAIAQLRTVLGMKSDFLLAHLWLGRALLQVGRYDEALAEARIAEAALRDWPVIVTAKGFAYGTMGRRDEARVVLKEMQELAGRRFVTAYGMGLVYAGLGDKDNAFAWLDRAFEERSHWLVWLRLDPRWNALRGDPRFDALVARMNYPA